MRFNRYPKIAIRSVTAVVALLAGIAVLFFIEQRRTQAEFGAVLSAYLSDEVLHDAHDWGSGHGIQIILQREAQQPGTWRWRWSPMFDRRVHFPQASLVTQTSFVVNNAVASDIRAGLHLPRGVDSIVVSPHGIGALAVEVTS